ncbi:unnamed protein product [Polarella glacialis]|uniref:Uncharacterized protein n=1 Tax=Polarella glacialis TaxID=89957 RepID=A0A813GAU8_POLGL|nr:unnamed protein product [Polarella glacialis]
MLSSIRDSQPIFSVTNSDKTEGSLFQCLISWLATPAGVVEQIASCRFANSWIRSLRKGSPTMRTSWHRFSERCSTPGSWIDAGRIFTRTVWLHCQRTLLLSFSGSAPSSRCSALRAGVLAREPCSRCRPSLARWLRTSCRPTN